MKERKKEWGRKKARLKEGTKKQKNERAETEIEVEISERKI